MKIENGGFPPATPTSLNCVKLHCQIQALALTLSRPGFPRYIDRAQRLELAELPCPAVHLHVGRLPARGYSGNFQMPPSLPSQHNAPETVNVMQETLLLVDHPHARSPAFIGFTNFARCPAPFIFIIWVSGASHQVYPDSRISTILQRYWSLQLRDQRPTPNHRERMHQLTGNSS